MTKITLRKEEDRYTIECDGHATGSVECCSAISMMACTLIEWSFTHEESVVERVVGDALFKMVLQGGDGECLYDFVSVGFNQLAQNYPQFVSIVCGVK